MNATPKTKLCWNCEARVSPYEENCPYCCVYLNPIPKPRGLVEEATENLAPPYRNSPDNEVVPQSPFSTSHSKTHENISDELALESDRTEKKGSSSLIPLSLLLCGSIFLLFSVSLSLFSINGVLTLKWNGQYWYMYLIVAIPLIFLGWRSLQNISENE